MDHFRRQQPAESLGDKASSREHIEENAEHNITKRCVRAAILELTSDQQQVITLKFLEGWENDEIAHVLNKPVGAVKSLQHRALTHLQKILLDDEKQT